jgi:hypothetical protein
MKIAIMQPYVFPYLGYFQLINTVDVFVFYDDVNYIKQGWINRNNILVNGQPLLFTIPLKKQSSFIKINEVMVNENICKKWQNKFLRTLKQSYSKAPFFEEVFPIVENVFTWSDEEIQISKLAINSVVEVCNYLDINTKIIPSSTIYENHNLSGQERVIDICNQEKGSHYINPIGGQKLYEQSFFKENNLDLNFIQSSKIEYKQFGEGFTPWLSIIDVIMFNSAEDVKNQLKEFRLL